MRILSYSQSAVNSYCNSNIGSLYSSTKTETKVKSSQGNHLQISVAYSCFRFKRNIPILLLFSAQTSRFRTLRQMTATWPILACSVVWKIPFHFTRQALIGPHCGPTGRVVKGMKPSPHDHPYSDIRRRGCCAPLMGSDTIPLAQLRPRTTGSLPSLTHCLLFPATLTQL